MMSFELWQNFMEEIVHLCFLYVIFKRSGMTSMFQENLIRSRD